MSPIERPRLSELSPSELRARAAQYRCLAATAAPGNVQDGLLRIAARLEGLAAGRGLGIATTQAADAAAPAGVVPAADPTPAGKADRGALPRT
jgi:hypothetical protein